jgi:hypothetical protein
MNPLSWLSTLFGAAETNATQTKNFLTSPAFVIGASALGTLLVLTAVRKASEHRDQLAGAARQALPLLLAA